MDWQSYITSPPQVLLGKPVIKGTRVPVELILELFEQGWDTKMIQESYLNITAEDVQAVFAYAKECIQSSRFLPTPTSLQ